MSGAITFPSVFIAGSGFMGSAIAYLVASKTGANGSAVGNAKVYIYDISEGQLEKAEQAVEKFGKNSLDKGFLTTAQLADVKKCIHKTVTLDDAKDADIVIEAIAEDLELKRALLASSMQFVSPRQFSPPILLLCR